MKYEPHPYQERAFKFLRKELHGEPQRRERSGALWLEMGLGKTVVVASAIAEAIDRMEVRKVLIVAPLRVVTSVWPAEFKKWDHLRWLRYEIIRGTATQRMHKLTSTAPIHLINYEMLDWLTQLLEFRFPYDLVVLDEASRIKSPGSKRFLAVRRVRKQIRTVIEMAGIPAPNGLVDLWAPMWAMDGGRRYGTTAEAFEKRWFRIGYTGRKEPMEHTPKELADRAADIALSMKTREHLDLPPRIVNPIRLALPPRARRMYDQLQEEMYLQLEETEITAFNQAALTNKCRQAASGALYTDETRKAWKEIHEVKLDALESVIEEAAGSPVLVGAWFRSDYARIMKRFPQARMLDADPQTQVDWNAGRIPILIANPQSAGHGLNMQYGGHTVVWFTMDWSWDNTEQFVCRLDRQGQTESVIVHQLIAEHTVDESVLRAVTDKRAVGEVLHEDMEEWRRTRKRS